MSAEIFLNGRVQLCCGDSLHFLRDQPDGRYDSVVTDPPYALVSISKRFGADGAAACRVPEGGTGAYARASAGFMGKKWDTGETSFAVEFWAEVLRVLKPGGHVVAFGGTRTYHRLVCAIEDAGFEVRDMLSWLYGSGFPKSHDVSKGIDRAAGAERVILAPHGRNIGTNKTRFEAGYRPNDVQEGFYTAPATNSAIEWKGWGTALKPACEPICLARKPLYSPEIDVRGIIEKQLYDRGFAEIIWTTKGSANGARKKSPPANLSSIEAQQAVEISAGIAAENETRNGEQQTRNNSGNPLTNGPPPIESGSDFSPAEQTQNSGTTFSPPMAANVSVAARKKSVSSQSTTSTEAARLTENQSTARSTDNCADKDSRQATESFAGIATGLTGSQAHVRINQNPDGSFAWPDDLPVSVPQRSLTVAANVLEHGTGAINIEGCRIAGAEDTARPQGKDIRGGNWSGDGGRSDLTTCGGTGRWPANLIHDGSEEVIAAFPEAPGQQQDIALDAPSARTGNVYGKMNRHGEKSSDSRYTDRGSTNFAALPGMRRGDSGSAARFFYTAKADADDRLGSKHPTVKPVDLMQWLVRLVTPKGGLVLDPFAGTGTTAEACFREGMRCMLVERETEYQADIRRRMALVMAGPDERARESIKAKTAGQPIDHGPLFAVEAAE